MDVHSAPPPLASIPALAAALRHASPAPASQTSVPQKSVPPSGQLLAGRALVPMYRVSPASPDPAAEAAAAAQLVVTVADRMRRMTAAYGEWSDFDAEAYFDLTAPQATRLLLLAERVTSVHLTFFTDLLLPSFQKAEAYWANCFRPQYSRMRRLLEQATEPEQAQHFFTEIQPGMIDHWRRLLSVADYTRHLLRDDPAFWSLNATNDERLRWRWAWRAAPAKGLPATLLPSLLDVPTLTLSIDFPLPAYRQPGRVRRLRRGRAWQQRHDNQMLTRRNRP